MSKQAEQAQDRRMQRDTAHAPLAPDFVGDAVDTTRGGSSEPGGGASVAAMALIAVLGAGVLLVDSMHATPGADTARSQRQAPAPAVAGRSPASDDPYRFILNALVVPALDSDAVPLRWADPGPRSQCGPATEVLVNHAPLVAGAPVPDGPFELEWRLDGCRPFGPGGPRYDGRAQLTVFREEWGLSAIVAPSDLHVRHGGQDLTLSQRRGARLPFIDESGESFDPVTFASGD